MERDDEGEQRMTYHLMTLGINELSAVLNMKRRSTTFLKTCPSGKNTQQSWTTQLITTITVFVKTRSTNSHHAVSGMGHHQDDI